MRTLSDNGRPDLALTIATQKTYPGWGYMVEKGATTVWELWNGDTADPAMNSGNHVMQIGDLGVWMYEYLAGIRSDPPVSDPSEPKSSPAATAAARLSRSCSIASRCPSSLRTTPASCRAACVSASRSPARSRTGRACC